MPSTSASSLISHATRAPTFASRASALAGQSVTLTKPWLRHQVPGQRHLARSPLPVRGPGRRAPQYASGRAASRAQCAGNRYCRLSWQPPRTHLRRLAANVRSKPPLPSRGGALAVCEPPIVAHHTARSHRAGTPSTRAADLRRAQRASLLSHRVPLGQSRPRAECAALQTRADCWR
jgi:hypothetical protein